MKSAVKGALSMPHVPPIGAPFVLVSSCQFTCEFGIQRYKQSKAKMVKEYREKVERGEIEHIPTPRAQKPRKDNSELQHNSDSDNDIPAAAHLLGSLHVSSDL
jgi:hypothetical protein